MVSASQEVGSTFSVFTAKETEAQNDETVYLKSQNYRGWQGCTSDSRSHVLTPSVTCLLPTTAAERQTHSTHSNSFNS